MALVDNGDREIAVSLLCPSSGVPGLPFPLSELCGLALPADRHLFANLLLVCFLLHCFALKNLKILYLLCSSRKKQAELSFN